MIAQIFEFTGNPRPRVTQPEPAIVLVLPVVRVEKENDVVDLRYLSIDRGFFERQRDLDLELRSQLGVCYEDISLLWIKPHGRNLR